MNQTVLNSTIFLCTIPIVSDCVVVADFIRKKILCSQLSAYIVVLIVVPLYEPPPPPSLHWSAWLSEVPYLVIYFFIELFNLRVKCFVSKIYKTGSLEMPPTTGLPFFCFFEKNIFEFDASQNSNTLTETKKREF